MYNKILKIIEKKPYLALWLILIVCLVMRVYRINELFPFTMDEEYQAFLANNMIKSHHIPLIGVNVADTGLYLGPLFTWFSAILYWLGNGNPLVTAWAGIAISLISCLLLIKTINLLISDYWLSLIGGLLYSVNPLIVMYDRKFWNPSFVMLLTVFWLYSILRAKKDQKWWWAVAMVFGLAFHTHYSLFVLAVPTLLIVFREWRGINVKKSKLEKLKAKQFLITLSKRFLITIIIFLTPLITFELRHGWGQIKGLIKYISTAPDYLGQFWYRFWIWHASLNRLLWLGFNRDMALELSLASISRSTLLLPISLIFILLLIYLYINKKFRNLVILNLGIGMAYLTALILFKSSMAEYYFLPLFPLMLILLITAIAVHIKNRGIMAEYYLGAVLALILVIWSGQSLSLRNSLGLSSKFKLIDKIKEITMGKTYELKAEGRYAFEGYRYLAQYRGIEPAKSYMDGHFSWLYQNEANQSVEMSLTIISKLDKETLTNFESPKIANFVALPGYLIAVE